MTTEESSGNVAKEEGGEEGRRGREEGKGREEGRRGREGRKLILSLSHNVNVYLSRQRERNLQPKRTHFAPAFFASNNKQ